MPKVEIYTSNRCPYCDRAKMLLKRKNVSFEEINLAHAPDRMEEMLQRAHGRRTVPQIFINNEGIGGCDELYALEKEKRLDVLLDDA